MAKQDAKPQVEKLELKELDNNETIVQELETPKTPVQETPKVDMIPLDQVNDLIEKRIQEALSKQKTQVEVETPKTQPRPSQDYSEKNINTDEIPGLENFEYKDRMYITVDGTKSPTFEIRSRHKKLSPLQFTNPNTKIVHTLRYGSNHPSFFVDQQKGADVLTTHILMKDGILRVPKENTTLQRFLQIHPDKDKIWKELDHALESKKIVDQEEILYQAQKLSREIGALELTAAARIFCVGFSEDWDSYTLKSEVYAEVKRRPEVFIKIATDKSLKAKGIIKTALSRGFIAYRNYKFYDGNNEEIFAVGRNENELDAMINYMDSTDGKALYEYLENAVN